MPAPPEADYTEDNKNDIVLFGIKLMLTSSTQTHFNDTHILAQLYSAIHGKIKRKKGEKREKINNMLRNSSYNDNVMMNLVVRFSLLTSSAHHPKNQCYTKKNLYTLCKMIFSKSKTDTPC